MITRSNQAVWAWHRWLGLSLGAVVCVLSVTGGLLVAQRELGESAERRVTMIAPLGGRVPLTALLAAVQEAAPAGMRLRSAIFDPDPAHAIRVQLSALPLHPHYVNAFENRLMYATVDPYTGRVLSLRDENRVLDRWIRTLHVTLFAGRAGVIVTTLASFILISQCLTGLWIYRGALKGLWRHPFRHRLGWRAAFGDLHRWMGVAGLVLNLIWGVTGAFMMTYSLPSVLARPEAPRLGQEVVWDATKSPALEPLIAKARGYFPTAEVQSVDLPLSQGEPIAVSLLQRDAAVWAKFPAVQFDATSGALLHVVRPGEGSLWDRMQASVKPLHFGFFGAGWVKWLYFVAAWSPAILFVTGFFIWRWDCRKKRNLA